jgi:hypothetical protein
MTRKMKMTVIHTFPMLVECLLTPPMKVYRELQSIVPAYS